jgi:hypothetical protein
MRGNKELYSAFEVEEWETFLFCSVMGTEPRARTLPLELCPSPFVLVFLETGS